MGARAGCRRHRGRYRARRTLRPDRRETLLARVSVALVRFVVGMVSSHARFLAAIALAVALASCAQHERFPDNSIEIGIDLPISGADGSVGRSTLNGMLLAIDEANGEGVPGGFKFVPVTLDDTVNGIHDARLGAQNARNFADDPNVLAMIGPYN